MLFRFIARGNLIFRLHVHVGIEGREGASHTMNATPSFLPPIFALATHSPFFPGANTRPNTHRTSVSYPFPRPADRQLAVWERTNDVRSVVDFIVQETHLGLE